MLNINLSFTDFWEGHDPLNNIITNSLRYALNCDVTITSPSEADVCFVTVYGHSFNHVLTNFRQKTILWLGENIRPNTMTDGFSISFDFHSYGGKNFRLPLWFSEIDWFGTGLGVVDLDLAFTKLVEPHSGSLDLLDREFCITIFNNPEGTRLEALRILQGIDKVTCYGRPFGNWFPTHETYQDKLARMSGYIFNLCPENSLYPGYYTEKCIHAKLAGSIPIYMADHYVRHDFNPKSFLNLNDHLSLDHFSHFIRSLMSSKDSLEEYIKQPLLYRMPSLDLFYDFLRLSIYSILSTR